MKNLMIGFDGPIRRTSGGPGTVRYVVLFAMIAIIAAILVKSSNAGDSVAPRQLIVVVSNSWNDVQARLYRFDRTDRGWKKAGGPFTAVVGGKGLAWGIGQHEQGGAGPIKKEGDRKGPAGMFRLVTAMGYDAAPPAGVTFPYEQAKETLHCVDDPASKYYNQIIDERGLPSPPKTLWKSSEVMKRKDNQYRWLIVVDHNRKAPKRGAGSCIFIHIWRSQDKGTAGCTALEEKDIVELLQWLKRENDPLLVQLPRPVYETYWKTWNLPAPELLDQP